TNGPEAVLLAANVDDLHCRDLDRLVLLAEHELDRGLDLRFRRVLHHTEDHLLVLVGDERALLGDHGREQHGHQPLAVEFGGRAHAKASSNCLTAPLVSSTWLKRTRLTGSTSRVSNTRTSVRLREPR